MRADHCRPVTLAADEESVEPPEPRALEVPVLVRLGRLQRHERGLAADGVERGDPPPRLHLVVIEVEHRRWRSRGRVDERGQVEPQDVDGVARLRAQRPPGRLDRGGDGESREDRSRVGAETRHLPGAGPGRRRPERRVLEPRQLEAHAPRGPRRDERWPAVGRRPAHRYDQQTDLVIGGEGLEEQPRAHREAVPAFCRNDRGDEEETRSPAHGPTSLMAARHASAGHAEGGPARLRCSQSRHSAGLRREASIAWNSGPRSDSFQARYARYSSSC